MRIEGNARTGQVGTQNGAARSSGAGVAFQPSGPGETARAASMAPAASAAGIDALLALQAAEDPLQKKQRVVRRGRDLLDTLDSLKADLIMGRINPGKLDQLMKLIAQSREKTQPGLDRVLDDIELRARVELAKLGRFPTI